jgi:predicted Holliday junction resolvase-like endonuclease
MQDVLIIVILALLAVIMVQQISHTKERKDLYNRIMARDLTEYTHTKQHDKENDKRLSAMTKKYNEYRNKWKL